jgi:two-component system CheB/CheR fusion protein
MMVNALRPGHMADLVPRRPPLGGAVLRQRVDEHVLERYSPAHVVVNRDGDVVYYSNKTGKYLEAPAGTPTRQLLTLARKGLRLDLRTAFREAVETGHSVSRDGLAVENESGGVQILNILVEPLADGGDEPLFLILFVDQGPVLSREEALLRVDSTQEGAALHVERELRETRDRLQSMIEEYETALEELKSSNEELVSVNEEMQSTNEELEASKEELQSVNEELHTVNGELTSKIEALDRANNDLQNLFESTEVATIFLDRALTIRSYTPSVARVFNILPSDRGRPITDLSSRLSLRTFADDIRAVLDGGEALERRVTTDDGATHYLVRLSPYRSAEGRSEGIVVAFIDITNVTHAEARQSVLIAELQHRTRNLLTVVQSVARRTIGKGDALDAFSARLQALGRIQDVISRGRSGGIDLADMVNLELEAVGFGASDRVHVEGPKVALGFDILQTLALVVHELTTNALKYGALKSPQGHLAISWRVKRLADANLLGVDWKETGVTMPAQTEKRGFGRELIERILSPNISSGLKFTADGVHCHLEIPLDELTNRVSS